MRSLTSLPQQLMKTGGQVAKKPDNIGDSLRKPI
jgi:hypothetical protein